MGRRALVGPGGRPLSEVETRAACIAVRSTDEGFRKEHDFSAI